MELWQHYHVTFQSFNICFNFNKSLFKPNGIRSQNSEHQIFFFQEISNLNYGPYHCLTCHFFSGFSSGITKNLMLWENSNKSSFIYILITLYMPKCFRVFCSLSYLYVYSLQSLYFQSL